MTEEYRILTTDDGTPTVFAGEFQEAMHSTSGAYDEALRKHVIPSRILETIKPVVRILDVGAGLCYNMLAALVELERARPDAAVRIVSLEKSREFFPIMEQIVFNDDRDRWYGLVKKGFAEGSVDLGRVTLSFLFGDARQSIRAIDAGEFDAVFQDPFSPAKNPELWTVEFFREVRGRMSAAGILTTYSAAAQVRGALVEAGFRVGRGPGVGMKREGTLASPGPVPEALSAEELAQLRCVPRAIPYRDPEMRDERETILARRRDEMRLLK